MNTEKHFDVLIVVTPADCERLLPLYPRLVANFDYGNLCFIGSAGVGDLVKSSAIADRAGWVDENDIVPFDDVHACMTRRLEPILQGKALPRGVTGWYYQQFLKMQYSAICKDEYYMVWDGDTIPCRKINMFSTESGQPYLDLKHEHHPEYFETMGKLLPGFGKVIERSFISEHMLFKCDIMRGLIADIEKNDSIPGVKFWEKIINAIEPEKIYDSAFSEFETYGTYVALKHPSVYRLREWHSFRLGGSFYEIDTITDGDFSWLGVDFDAISFEKGQTVLEENKGYFDNPEVQAKISARKLLQAAQMEYKDGYKEVWEDDAAAAAANVRAGSYGTGRGAEDKTLIVVATHNEPDLVKRNLDSIQDTLKPESYKVVAVDKDAGFVAACNQAVKASVGTEFEGADVFLLSSDTCLVYDSLYFLRQALYAEDDIGAVGCLSNCAANKQQMDVVFDTVDEYIKFGEKVNVPTANPCLERVRLSSFAMLIRRNVWDEIGGLDEDFAPGYYADDALSLEILKKGYRLEIVRNSFIYCEGSQGGADADFDDALEEQHQLFLQKYGFDISQYAYASGTVISQIPYGPNDRFAVLHFGCGLGSELKAIRSLFPYSDLYGVETNGKLFDIVRKTEKVFAGIDELLEFIDVQFFNVLIVENDTLAEMDQEERNILGALMMPNPVVIVGNDRLENFPYEKIKLIIWGMDNTFWQGVRNEGEVILPMSNADLVKNAADHGVVSSVFARDDEAAVFEELEGARVADMFVFNTISPDASVAMVADKIRMMGLEPSDVLFVDADPETLIAVKELMEDAMTADTDIIPYLANFFAKTKATDIEHSKLAYYNELQEK
ncbi:hypothetical protein D6855_06700 [Butyrivibrio sp. CB08]|uniref:DUF6492 family protein n=1 Tax=Butyrivibrio sp. CB08 TaxID=2364879 RepID=UPI000EA91C04|nr:DUF6492 family protein [Butyrivibrio sp. CB08]RKM60403.1 hypothetical protein D6855_06700 [Butyrivibrio sp. CB08]